jgi:hypothetical protein
VLPPSQSRSTIILDELAETCAKLARRIHASFPDRGIDEHAQCFVERVKAIVKDGRRAVEAPQWLTRLSAIGGVAAVTILVLVSVLCVRRVGDIDNLPTYLSSLDAFFTVLAATIAGGLTMRSIRHRVEQTRALKKLDELRGVAHVTDMLQIAKCPTRLLYSDHSSEAEAEDIRQMTEYLSYGAELQSLTAKVAAVYGRWCSDASVHAAIDGIERLCADLERKSLQKVLLLEQIHQRRR